MKKIKTTTICSQLLFICSVCVLFFSHRFLLLLFRLFLTVSTFRRLFILRLQKPEKRNLSMEIGIWALWWGSLFNLFLSYIHHDVPSTWHCYALNRIQMLFKFVQNSSILLAWCTHIDKQREEREMCIHILPHGKQMIQNRPMGFTIEFKKSNLQFSLGMKTLFFRSTSSSNSFQWQKMHGIFTPFAETNPRPDEIL